MAGRRASGVHASCPREGSGSLEPLGEIVDTPSCFLGIVRVNIALLSWSSWKILGAAPNPTAVLIAAGVLNEFKRRNVRVPPVSGALVSKQPRIERVDNAPKTTSSSPFDK